MSDSIDRQAAIDALAELARERFTIQDCFQIYLDALKDADIKIRQLPSAQPEPPEECERCMMEHTDEMEKLEAELAMAQPKRGQWHYSDGKPARIGLSFGVICDQCGTESEYCTNFCGECGADMREVTT